MGSDLLFEQRQRERDEWGPLSRAVDMIRGELGLPADTSPGVVGTAAVAEIRRLQAEVRRLTPNPDTENSR